MPLPSFVVVGAAKCGTTSLGAYLRRHPDVFVPERPVSFFDRYYERGQEWYRGQFGGATTERVIGDVTPGYLYPHYVPARLALVVPEATVVAILRNPADRAYSHYWFNRTRGHERLEFARALASEPERLVDPDLDPHARARYAYVDRGRYVEQLERLEAVVPRAQIVVVVSEELRSSRSETMSTVYRAVGLDGRVEDDWLAGERNRYVEYRSMALRRPVQRLPMPLRRVATRLNTRPAPAGYPPMAKEVRSQLQESFEPYNRRLAAWIGRDLPAWGL